MGFFSKSEPAADALPTSTAPKVEEQKKSGGIFCGMNLTEALIASFLLFLFVFFVLWPMITAYFFMACLWIIMWPFVNYIPACANHKYVAPGYGVLGVMVCSPVKVAKFIYDRYKGDKKPEDDAAVIAAAASAATAATAVQQKV